jgi:succinylarginine dihydrolase
MWAANAATVSPSPDCADGKLHVSVANLQTMLHRRLEAKQTEKTLQTLLGDETHFTVHGALTAQQVLSDEGGANHMRMAAGPGTPGVEIFIYGRGGEEATRGFPARQTLEASRAIARRHQLSDARTVFARQSGEAISAGAFHNDVVAVAHEHVLFHHEHAFADKEALKAEIRAKASGMFKPIFVEVTSREVSLEDAITSYLFNSQLIRRPGQGKLTLICPTETRENNQTAAVVHQIINEPNGVIGAVEYVEVRESMRNGGGPACLRLRMQMTRAERAAAAEGFFLTDALGVQLEDWVRAHYRETLAPADLADPSLVDETQTALDRLTKILPLGSDFYPFQRV